MNIMLTRWRTESWKVKYQRIEEKSSTEQVDKFQVPAVPA